MVCWVTERLEIGLSDEVGVRGSMCLWTVSITSASPCFSSDLSGDRVAAGAWSWGFPSPTWEVTGSWPGSSLFPRGKLELAGLVYFPSSGQGGSDNPSVG